MRLTPCRFSPTNNTPAKGCRMPSPSSLTALESHYHTQLSVLWQPLGAPPFLSYHADRRVKTASIIKLPILTYTALQVEQGHLAWEQRLDLPQ